ncbi:MAG TPA: hypothetical protein VMB50_16195 [Myxococcales bacterium]|nr:hypothetical protein [Myxococcales bacterium]
MCRNLLLGSAAAAFCAACQCSSGLTITPNGSDAGVTLGAGSGVRDPALDAGLLDGGISAGAGLDGGTDGGQADAGAGAIHAALLGDPLPSTGWTFYGTGSGLSATPSDVSADEGGNVYVAGGDAVYAKTRGASTFLRFDQTAGLTTNCDVAETQLCPVISVAGGGAGQAFIGLQGIGTDQDLDPLWEQESGGVDALAFDGQHLTRTRHVLIATPPGVVAETPYTMANGRRKGRQVFRVVFNHFQGPHYGDVWMGGTHVGFSVLFANPAAEGWVDYPPSSWINFPQEEAPASGVWEHDHPAVEDSAGDIETGDYYGIAIDPVTGDPWAGNEYRTASKQGFGASTVDTGWELLWPPYDPTNQLQSYLDVWPDQLGADGWDDIENPAWKDNTEALAFCADGTLWIGSSTLGLARRSPAGAIDYFQLPQGFNQDVYALACDPSDSSIWMGSGWGGVARLHPDGTWSLMPAGLGPDFVQQPVRSIQIDSWASPRIVYFAHLGSAAAPGGVSAYDGP